MSDPAFPNGPDITGGRFAPHGGMTQRQYYKAKALAGLMASPTLHGIDPEGWTEICARVADAMLAEDAKYAS